MYLMSISYIPSINTCLLCASTILNTGQPEQTVQLFPSTELTFLGYNSDDSQAPDYPTKYERNSSFKVKLDPGPEKEGRSAEKVEVTEVC